MKQKTALQTAIEKIEARQVHECNNPDAHFGLQVAKNILESLLPQSEQEIKESFECGHRVASFQEELSSSRYFTNKYEN